jgi:hypothetical protein
MVNKLISSMVALVVLAGLATAEEFDAVVNDPARGFAKQKKAADKFSYCRITLDSKGKVVSMIYKDGTVTKDTKVVMATFDEKKRKWTPGEAVEGGVGADIFKAAGKVVRMRMVLADDKTTIQQILVTNADEKLAMSDPEFDAIYKRHGPQTNGTGSISYVRVELDEKGKVINTFALTTTTVTKDTKIVMGKYNEKEKSWEAGDEIPEGLYNDIFKDAGAKTIYVRITSRDDRRGIAQILVRQIGEKGKK